MRNKLVRYYFTESYTFVLDTKLLMPKQLKSQSEILLFQVGGATALIGDPSGKTTDRQPMSPFDIENNTVALTNQLNHIFANHEEYIWKHQHKKLKPVK